MQIRSMRSHVFCHAFPWYLDAFFVRIRDLFAVPEDLLMSLSITVMGDSFEEQANLVPSLAVSPHLDQFGRRLTS